MTSNELPSVSWFSAAHLESFEPGERDAGEMTADNRETLLCSPGALSIRHEGRTLGLMGFHEEGSTVTAWMILSDELRERFWRDLYRMCRKVLPTIHAMAGVERIEAHVAADWSEARRMVEHLGFRRVAEDSERVVYRHGN